MAQAEGGGPSIPSPDADATPENTAAPAPASGTADGADDAAVVPTDASAASEQGKIEADLRQQLKVQEELIRELLVAQQQQRQEQQEQQRQRQYQVAAAAVVGTGNGTTTGGVGGGRENDDRGGDDDGEEDGETGESTGLLSSENDRSTSSTRSVLDAGDSSSQGLHSRAHVLPPASGHHAEAVRSMHPMAMTMEPLEVGFMTDAEKEDARLALMMQNMEIALQAGGGDEEMYFLEDPVWGKLKLKPGQRRPNPAQVVCFGCCPCLMGNVLDWSGEGRTYGCGNMRLRIPRCHEDKKGVLKSFVRTWSFILAVLQVAIMLLMMAWDGGGLAPAAVNPMLGPWPPVLLAFGAKNTYMILHSWQWWRLLTPVLLHAGWIHLGVNVLIQLKIGSLLEKEWGTRAWLFVFIVSGTFSSLMSAVLLPNQLAVGSSGALMGLMGAWVAELVCRWGGEDASEQEHRQRSNNFVMATLNISVTLGFSFVPYVDYAAHIGGMVMGALLGVYLYGPSSNLEAVKRHARRVASACAFCLFALGLVLLLTCVHPSEVLASQENVCEQFEQAYPESKPLPCCG